MHPTGVVDLRSVIALFLGLVIQLSQVPSCLAREATPPCATQAHAMACCEDMKSCPCVKEGEPAGKPAPLVPAAVDLKWFGAKASEPVRVEPLISPPGDAVPAAVVAPENHGGFYGVPLSVAFCSYLI